MITSSEKFFSNQQPLIPDSSPFNHNKTLFLSTDSGERVTQSLPHVNENPHDTPENIEETPDYTNDIYSRFEQWPDEEDEYTYLTAYNQMQITPHY